MDLRIRVPRPAVAARNLLRRRPPRRRRQSHQHRQGWESPRTAEEQPEKKVPSTILFLWREQFGGITQEGGKLNVGRKTLTFLVAPAIWRNYDWQKIKCQRGIFPTHVFSFAADFFGAVSILSSLRLLLLVGLFSTA